MSTSVHPKIAMTPFSHQIYQTVYWIHQTVSLFTKQSFGCIIISIFCYPLRQEYYVHLLPKLLALFFSAWFRLGGMAR